jgi:2-keto-4-pentenoate hydratase/2-oxohepta-3-ene-1,7-dioic acid hydratase in catechol pathway
MQSETLIAERPMVFMKNPASVIGNGEPIVIPAICNEPDGTEQVDYEGELAVIVGERCRDVPVAEALTVVSGYAVANDVSARWWQKHGSGGQFVRGKSFDTFCPVSEPVPASAVPNPQALDLVTKLNGEIVQRANTGAMIFPIATLIAELSRAMTLLPGTVILTGTPAGVGVARTPPRFLRDGDEIAITIESVGTLTNPVIRG